MGFKDLPNDLKNIVSDFAYKCKWETVENDLEMCIKKMQISDVFVRNGSVYVTHRRVIDTGNIIGNDCRGYLMPKERSLDVNEEIDFLFAEFLSDRNLV